MSLPPGFDREGLTSGPGFVLLNDEPVGEVDDDLLDATEVARGLTDLIIASRTAAPFTLAVDAPWGMGKSSLMRLLDATLSAEQSVSTVWFNAWTSGEASALEGLIKSVLLRFDRNIIRRAARSMSRRTHLLGLLGSFALLVGSFVGLGRAVDQLWRTMALNAQSRNQIKGVLRDAFAEWIKNGSTPDNRRLLAVFIDDLDRCGSARVIEICEAIKLYLDVPGIVFVLGCDRTALRRAVDDAVGVDDPPGAAEYLEKIIQVTHTIPAPSPSQAMRLVEGYLARSYTGQLFNEPMKSLIIERSGRNPRRIKGMINDFMLAYHLNRSLDNVDARRAAWGQPSASAGELSALFSAHVAYLDFDAHERSFDSPARARAVGYRRQATRTDWPWIRGKPPLREGRDVLGIRIVWIDDHSEIDRRMALALAAIAHEPPEVVLSGDLKQVEAGSP